MIKMFWLLLKKEIIETISNKRKLWPFVFVFLPLFMFFYTKGTESMFDVETAVYFIPVFITTIIAMQLSSTSMLNEKNCKMLDVLLGMKINPAILVFAKNIFAGIFSMLVGLIFILIMKYGTIYVFKEDLLILDIGFLVLLSILTYFSSVITFLFSMVIRELSVIPIVSSLGVIVTVGFVYYLVLLFGVDMVSSLAFLIMGVIMVLLSIVLTFVSVQVLIKSKFIISI